MINKCQNRKFPCRFAFCLRRNRHEDHILIHQYVSRAGVEYRLAYRLGEAVGVSGSGGRESNFGSGVGAWGAASKVLRSSSTAPIRPLSAVCTTTRTLCVLDGTRSLMGILVDRPSDSLSDDPPFYVGIGPADRASVFGVRAEVSH